MSEVLLTANNLVKRFGGLAAVNGVSLELWRGTIHAVIGPNGAGKSTLTNLLSGDAVPPSGSVTLGGSEVTGCKPACKTGCTRWPAPSATVSSASWRSR